MSNVKSIMPLRCACQRKTDYHSTSFHFHFDVVCVDPRPICQTMSEQLYIQYTICLLLSFVIVLCSIMKLYTLIYWCLNMGLILVWLTAYSSISHLEPTCAFFQLIHYNRPRLSMEPQEWTKPWGHCCTAWCPVSEIPHAWPSSQTTSPSGKYPQKFN